MGGSFSADFDYQEAILADTRADRVYSQPLDEEPEEGYGVPRRCNLALAKGKPETYDTDTVKAATIWDIFNLSLDTYHDQNFLAARAYTPLEPGAAPTPLGPESQRVKNYAFSGYVERPDGSVLRGDYRQVNFTEVNAAALAFARGLVRKSIAAPGAHVGIFSANRPEWIVAALGCFSHRMAVVSLYPTLGPHAIEYIIGHAATPAVVVSKENLPTLLKLLKEKPAATAATLKTVILIDALFEGRFGNTLDTVSAESKAAAAALGVELLGMSEVIAAGADAEAAGEESPAAAAAPTGDDLAFIMYTSGTTGDPKGVMLSHRNVVATVAGIKPLLEENHAAFARYFSFLPLAHIYETVVQAVVWARGGVVFFSQGDPRFLVDDLKVVRPTLMPGVPRIYQKIHQKVFAQVDGMNWLKRWYIYRAYNYQTARLRAQEPLDAAYDEKVFKVMREKIGLGDVKIIVNGGAPCPPYLVEFLRVLSNAWVTQGYGLTETSAASSLSLMDDPHVGECGPPTPVNDLRLADIPEMGYSSAQNPPTGEILFCGANTFVGYYKNAQATEEAYFTDKQGRKWLRTGDVGRWNPNGTISIIDRKKNMIKLGQGEYVALEKVEDAYGRADGVSQIWIYGNGYKNSIVAVVVPDAAALHAFAVERGWWNAAELPAPTGALSAELRAAMAALLDNAARRKEVGEWLTAALRKVEKGLLGFEKVRAVHVEPAVDAMGLGFNEENECLTPTMKKRRKQLTDKYVPVLTKLYAEIGEAAKPGEHW